MKPRRKSDIYRPLSKTVLRIFEILQATPALTRRQLAEIMGVHPLEIKDDLFRACKRGELVIDKSGGYHDNTYSIGVLQERKPPATKRVQYHDTWARKERHQREKAFVGPKKPTKVKAAPPAPKPEEPKVRITRTFLPKPVEPKPPVILPKPVKDPPMTGRDGKQMDRTKKWEPPKPPPTPEIVWPSSVKVTVHPTTYTKLDPRAHIK